MKISDIFSYSRNVAVGATREDQSLRIFSDRTTLFRSEVEKASTIKIIEENVNIRYDENKLIMKIIIKITRRIKMKKIQRLQIQQKKMNEIKNDIKNEIIFQEQCRIK